MYLGGGLHCLRALISIKILVVTVISHLIIKFILCLIGMFWRKPNASEMDSVVNINFTDVYVLDYAKLNLWLGTLQSIELLQVNSSGY